MILASILSFIILILLVFISIQFFNVLFCGYAPFLSTKKNLIKQILKNIYLEKNSHIYELGCGFAWFLSSAEKQFPDSYYTGIEYSFLPYLLAKIRLVFTKSKIKIINKNFLKINLSSADLIYCYLIPSTMNRLSAKIQNECKLGTIVISHKFPLPNLVLYKSLKIENNNFYFYKV